MPEQGRGSGKAKFNLSKLDPEQKTDAQKREEEISSLLASE